MSDSPIFDRMAADRGYARLTAARAIPAMGERQGAVQPDPILDSPVPLAPEEEVYVRPFVKVEGEPRGLAPKADFLKARVMGVDPQILKDQMEAHGYMWRDYVDQRVEALNYNYLAVVESVRSIALINQAEGVEKKRIEYSFNPLDLDESGLSFTDFAHAVTEGFRRGYPEVKDYWFMTKHGDIESSQEVFVVEEVVKVTPDTIKNIKPGDSLEITFPKGSRRPQDGVLAGVEAAFRQQYPEHVMVSVKGMQEHEDGSATLTVEGQSVASVKPLSEMETAQHTE